MIQLTTRNNLRHYDRRLAVLLDDKTPVQIREKVRGLRDQGKLPRPNDLPDGSSSSDPDEEMSDPDKHDSDDLPGVDDAAEEVLATGPEWHTSLTLAWLATEQSGTLEDALKDLIQGEEELSQKSVDEYVTRLTTASLYVRTGQERRAITKRTRRPNIKRKRYAQTQELFKKNPQRLAEIIRKGEASGLLPNDETPQPPAQELFEQYSTLWETPGTSRRTFPPRPITHIVSAITASEVHERVKKLKNSGAPGADGLTKSMLLNLGNYQNVLAGLFNVILEKNL